MTGYAGVVLVVRHKVSKSHISRTVWSGITKVYRNLHIGWVYNRTGYDITIYFRPEVIGVEVVYLRSRISRESFQLESPDFTRITYRPDTTSLHTSRLKLSRKICRQCCLLRLHVEYLEKGLNKDRQVSNLCWRRLAPKICPIWHHYLFLVNCKTQLDSAQKWCVKRFRIIRPLFNRNSSNCTRLSMPT